jgi:hypothetical protein
MSEQQTEQTDEPAEAPADATDEQKDRQRLLRQAYGAATTRLREQYRDEFDRLYAQEAQALGIEYKPRPTAEQKAAEQMRALLEEYPHLREQLQGAGNSATADHAGRQAPDPA